MGSHNPFSDADRDELVAYLDGELDAEAQRRVEARLNTDAVVRTEADTLKRAWELLDYLPRAEPSTDFTERTLDRVSALQVAKLQRTPTTSAPVTKPWYRRRDVGIAAWAASCLLALGIGYAWVGGPKAKIPEIDPDTDPLVLNEPRLIENLPLYLAAENLDYLNLLDKNDLFTDETSGR